VARWPLVGMNPRRTPSGAGLPWAAVVLRAGPRGRHHQISPSVGPGGRARAGRAYRPALLSALGRPVNFGQAAAQALRCAGVLGKAGLALGGRDLDRLDRVPLDVAVLLRPRGCVLEAV